MKLSELLVPEQVVLPLTGRDKWEAIAVLVRAAVRAGALAETAAAEVEAALIERERSMTTGMEHGIAIPHAAVDRLADVIAVMGIARAGIPFDTIDHEPARIVVCLVIPRAKKLLHIKTLAEIARLLARAPVRERLLACTTPEAVVDAVRQEGG
jgi:mannitol/fructose-specific phosphotransferase system IIA component (Ntr-type)